MKIRVEIDDEIVEDEIIIRCRQLNDEILEMQEILSDHVKSRKIFTASKSNTDYYLNLNDLYFFETEGDMINVHTANDIYHIKQRLYELEDTLPGYFTRISKSCIVNVKKIRSINRSISNVGTIELEDTYKQVFVSRYYYKPLKNKLEEMRK